MDLTEPESRKGSEMELNHFSHHHPLVFITQQDLMSFVSDEDDQSCKGRTNYCRGCDKKLLEEDGGSRYYYGCKECKYYLHKECGELELSPEIDHPFHPKHLLNLFPTSPNQDGVFRCSFCNTLARAFVYNCNVCMFDLHVSCALLQPSIAPNCPNSLHPHPLSFIHNHDDQLRYLDCCGCKKPLSGPIYHCSDCSDHPNFFNLHKECAELPLEINHPYDRNHPLTLLLNPPTHPYTCRCYLCKIH